MTANPIFYRPASRNVRRCRTSGEALQLVRYDAARTALAELQHIDEILEIHDKAPAM